MTSTPLNPELEREWADRIVKNILDLIVLKLLQKKSKWGYEMNMEIKDRFNIYLSAGTLYPLLHSLEDRGLVAGVSDEGGRGRRVYKITSKGRHFLFAGETMLKLIVKNLSSTGP